jgi:pimeloyl-ACP methyl ester carboxylesterase
MRLVLRLLAVILAATVATPASRPFPATVVVVGDLATADRIAVLVPGVGTTAATFATGQGGVRRRAPVWQAQQLYARARSLDPTARVAVIAWLGYDPPRRVRLEAMREDCARRGAAALDRYVAGLVVERSAVSLVVVGHSYGSTVLGLAAAGLPAQVTDVVALGSPGLGVDRAADLHAHARIWAGSGPDDWTRELPQIRVAGLGHGTNPTDPRFGARVLAADNVRGHDGYYVPGTRSLDALASLLVE